MKRHGGEAADMDKETLRNYRSIKSEIKQLENRIEELQSASTAPGIQHITGMPVYHGIDHDKLSVYVAKKDELLKKYINKKTELIKQQIEIENAIDSLCSVQRRLLRHRYIEGMGWEDICKKMNYGWAQVHRIHGAALQKLNERE